MRELNQTEIATVTGGKLTDALIRAAINGVKRFVSRAISPGPTM